MSVTILFLWTVVAAGSSGRVYSDWRPVGEFVSHAACEEAKRLLGPEAQSRGRCIATSLVITPPKATP